MAALIQEEVYEEIGAFRARQLADIEGQFQSFNDGSLPGGQLHWAVRDSDTNTCVGSLQATANSDGSVSIGYRVRSENQNRGIATESLRQLLNELNSRFPERALVATADPKNVASLRVLAKCGFESATAETSVATGTMAQLFLKYLNRSAA